MDTLLSTAGSEFEKTFCEISSWNLAVMSWEYRDNPVYSDYWTYECEKYLGHSEDKSAWALATPPWRLTSDSGITNEQLKASCSPILLDPPRIREAAILQILFRVTNEIRKSGTISADKIDEIFSTEGFVEYRQAQTYLPELPESWLHLPAQLCVNFVLSEGACLYPAIFEEYRRGTLEEALKVLYSPRHDGLLFEYSLVAKGAIPLLAWDIDWPLSRRGKTPAHKREKVSGTLPWEKPPTRPSCQYTSGCRVGACGHLGRHTMENLWSG